MTVGDDAAKAVLALTNRLVDAGVAPLKASETWRLLDAVGDPSALLGRSADELSDDLAGLDLDPDRVARLLDSGVALAVRLGHLDDQGIWALTPFDEAYPGRLRDQLGPAAPVVLYGAGDRSLLRPDESGPDGSAGIGLVGSRSVDDAGAACAVDAGRALAATGTTVVSGGSVGVDHLAMTAAIEAGGTAVGILADSLESAIATATTRRALLDGRVCLCTPYRPDLPRDRARAEGRNKIVYALVIATLVVAVERDADSTWAGATEALGRGAVVAVWRGPGEGPDNGALEGAGARAVTDLSDLLDLRDVS